MKLIETQTIVHTKFMETRTKTPMRLMEIQMKVHMRLMATQMHMKRTEILTVKITRYNKNLNSNQAPIEKPTMTKVMRNAIKRHWKTIGGFQISCESSFFYHIDL